MTSSTDMTQDYAAFGLSPMNNPFGLSFAMDKRWPLVVWVVLNIGILVFNRLLHLWLAPADTGKHVWLRTQWAAKCTHGSRSFGDCKAWRTICVQALRSLALFLKWNVGLPSRPPEGLALPSCSGGGLFHHIDFKVVHLNFLPVALLLPFWRTSCRTTPTTSGCSRVGKSVRNRL